MILIFDLQIFFSDYAYYDDLETDYDFLPSIRVPSGLECTRRVRLPQRVLRALPWFDLRTIELCGGFYIYEI